MKKFTFLVLMSVAIASPAAHAYIASCNDGATLVSRLQVVKAKQCLGGMALIDSKGAVRCTHVEDGSILEPGFYRACVLKTDTGLVITAAEGSRAE